MLLMLVASGAAPAGDPATDVRAVFSAKCVACHGPNLAKPKGRFGYVLDLTRVANNREMVVPGAPDESEMWELVRRGEMPPDDSPTGPLTADQKEAIRAWIAAGSPSDDRPDVGPTREASRIDDSGRFGVPPVISTLHRLGRLHFVLVHFPIALLIAAAAGEFWSAWRSRATPAPAVHFCVVLGASGAVTTAALGWLHAWGGAGIGMPVVLGLHRWLGTATAGWAVFTVVLSARDERRGVRSGWFRVALLMAALLVAATGHFGGVLVYGEDFFSAG
jgi:mono/diheme cytochrome c family protein/uncharacterized membrane protein